jgi:hypothetical protein
LVGALAAATAHAASEGYVACTPRAAAMRPIPPFSLGLGLAVLVCTAGCAADRALSGTEGGPTANVSGAPVALYPIPAAAPHGEVRVATLGIATLQPGRDAAEHVRALHVRLIVTNDDDRGAWELDTREQAGFLERYGRSRPAFASSTSGRPPLVTIVPGASVAVDLYYPLPTPMQEAAHVPFFEVLWRVQTPGKAVTERTSFQGAWLERGASPPGHAWDWSLWHPGWYDPFWPDDAFQASPPIAPAFYREPALLDPPHRAH